MEDKTPKVFISYSHDTPDHKRWVATFGAKLREKGVDVILDQWDLNLGDDLAKFMEDSLSTSDRVLLICTESYVRKANSGLGGVAYEKMIVTAEIVQNIGTNKFIPIVRQTASPIVLPTFIGHRYYVNLSTDNKFDSEFVQLLRELHRQPIMPKPPLGKNPFAQQASGGEIPESSHPVELKSITINNQDASRTYEVALETAK